MGYTVNHFIAGRVVTGVSDRFGDIYNPAQGMVAGKVAFASQQEVENAIASAKKAFPVWSAMPAIRRSRILFEYLGLLKKHLDELALLITQEHGKTLEDAKGSIMRGLEVLEFACGAPNLLKGWFSEEIATGVDSYTLRQPLGVCVGITPFNFPAMIPLWMFPLATVCGNTFVLKPSEKDPSCPLRLAELFKQAGAPDGVLNVVNGDQRAVDALLTHPDVTAISFVGSTAVAEHVYKTGTSYGKRVQAFGGAKNHCIVMPDADLEQAANALAGAAFGSAGERCMAISAVVAVGDAVADELIAQLKTRALALKIGAGIEPNIEMGPLVTKQHLEKVKSYIELGVAEGAQLIVDGRNVKPKNHNDGFFMGGSLFDHVKPNMRIYQEEIFGPVLVVVRVPDFATALKLVNDHPYGNGTAIFTRDGESARTFASQVKVGMVGINVPIPVPAPYHAFGGWKRSIFGDMNMHGSESISFYTRLKTVTERWPQGSQSLSHFVMPTHE